MITNPKTLEKVSIDEVTNSDVPRIEFLKQDGSLVEEPFEISPKGFYVSTNDGFSYGKIEHYANKTVYALKQFRGGRPGEYLVNPYGILSTPYDLSTNNDKRGERFCEYLVLREDLFRNYQDYLMTRNPRVFNYVEKQVKENNYL